MRLDPHAILDALEWADALLTTHGVHQEAPEEYAIIERALKTLRHELPHDNKPWETREKAYVPCKRCRNTGQIMVSPGHIGGGCYNPEMDVCPDCGGNGFRSAA